ncbi:MAG: NAD(P)/FAD-dependent oxidoreductase [Actinomycetes bacterium]
MNQHYDAIVVGGGHNGLVAAAYLAKAGLRPLVLEARWKVGGAATTETPWGPDYKMTSLSYVMSLMPQEIINDLQLKRYGYHVIPMGPSYLPLPDGKRSLTLSGDADHDRDQLSAFSRKDAAAFPKYEAWLKNIADKLHPLLLQQPPKVGSRRPTDLLEQAKLAWGMRELDVRGSADVTRLFTMSIADLLDEWFESPEVKGLMCVNGIIGTWAGPYEPGTAYVMMHHSIGDVGEGSMTGTMGSWGYPIGGMGAVSQAIADSAQAFGAQIKVNAPVARILIRNGRAYGVALEDGTEYYADSVVAATHPKITFLDQIDRSELPEEFVSDIEHWRSRSGMVKVNVALDGLPEFSADPDLADVVYSGAIEISSTMDYVERAFIDAREGRGAQNPFSDSVIPSTVDSSLAPEGHHVMSMFTQWVPHIWADDPEPDELEAYADRVIAQYEQVAPGFTNRILHRQVIGPHEMQTEYHLIGGNMTHGELSVDQLFHMRPAPGYADFTTPIAGLYQSSSATHGGGGVTGIAGLQASHRVLRDRKRRGRRNSA